tara:strand:+ start:759 stop:1292 length:534 start_codon:yes stop_codon:yes gene_type:complete
MAIQRRMNTIKKYLLRHSLQLRREIKPITNVQQAWKIHLNASNNDQVGIARYCLITKFNEQPNLHISQFKIEEKYRLKGHGSFMQYVISTHAKNNGATYKEESDVYTEFGLKAFGNLPLKLDDRIDQLEIKLNENIYKIPQYMPNPNPIQNYQSQTKINWQTHMPRKLAWTAGIVKK